MEQDTFTYIDGDEGILLHRGFPIDQLATESNYLEVCYILLNGEKPTQAQYDEFKTTVTRHTTGNLLMDHGVTGDGGFEFIILSLRRLFAVQQDVAHFQIVGFGG